MDHVQFGRSGLMVSRQAFGTWRLDRVDPDQVEPLINAALDAGINLIDTARGYGKGQAERLIGQAVRNRGGRDRVLVATKCSAPNPREPNGFMTSRRSIIQHCDDSLQRLGLDHIDLYQIHCVERFVPIDETLMALTDLVRSGKVRYIGASNYKGWQLVEACWAAEKHHTCKFVSDQSEYHLFDRRLERENFPAMQSYGMAALAYSPLDQGLLSAEMLGGPEALPDTPRYADYRSRPDHIYFSRPIQDALGRLAALAREHGRSPAQMALAFTMQREVPVIPIIAPSNHEQLTDCLQACDISSDDALRAAFDAINPPGEKLHGQRFNPYNHGPTCRWY